jgi:hypothetical protein
LNALIICIF